MQTKTIQWREASNKRITTAFAGDFCPREANSDDTARRADEITSEIKPYFSNTDFNILQWECAVTEKDTPIAKSGPNHRCFPPALAFARALRTDVVLLANNHIGDYGADGVKDTLEAFRVRNIQTVGAGMNWQEAEQVLTLEKNGIRIALLNAAEHEFGIAGSQRPGAAGLDVMDLSRRIRELKQNGALVITALHGGHEHYPFPSPRQQKLCRFLAENGADAVFNCHTHCPAGYEIYRGVPIVYSPGNFYFPPRPTSLPCWFIGYVPKFHCDPDGVYALELLPYYNYQSRLTLLSAADTERFFAYLDELNLPIAKPELLQEYFNAWCIISGLRAYLNTFRNIPAESRFESPEQIRPWLGIRNLLSCESHHDLLRNTLSLIEFGKVKEAEKKIPDIKRLQNPEWVVRK